MWNVNVFEPPMLSDRGRSDWRRDGERAVAVADAARDVDRRGRTG